MLKKKKNKNENKKQGKSVECTHFFETTISQFARFLFDQKKIVQTFQFNNGGQVGTSKNLCTDPDCWLKQNLTQILQYDQNTIWIEWEPLILCEQYKTRM